MAEPFDSAVTQQTVSTILQEQYYSKFLDVAHATGAVTNRLIAPMDLAVVGDGLNIKAKRYGGDHATVSNDALADFSAATPFDAKTYKVRWNERDPSAHDFTRVACTGRVSVYQFDEADSAGAITDIVDEIDGDIREDFNWTLAALRRIPRSGQIGLVNGTPTQNDRNFVADCSAMSSSVTMRCYVDNTSIPLFRPGKFYDVYNGSTLVIGNVRCVNVNEADTASSSAGSVGFEIVTTGAKQSTAANFGSVSDNYAFYLAGAYNKSMYSCEAWFTKPAAAESFIGGKNRSTADYQWMTPTLLRTGSTAQRISKDHFRQAGNVLSFVSDMEQFKFVALANPLLVDALREQYEAAAFVTYPSGDSRESRYANLGSMGVNIQHPSLGNVKLIGDPFMLPDHVDLMEMDSWKQCYRGSKGLRFLKDGGSMWYRMQSSTAGSGKSLFYGLDAYANLLDVCLSPRTNVRIAALTA